MYKQAWKGHPGGCLFSVLATVRFSEFVAWKYPFEGSNLLTQRGNKPSPIKGFGLVKTAVM